MDNAVLEYLEGYFGGQLNESTSDEDIMSAFVDLLETADAVEEFLINEKINLNKSKRWVNNPNRTNKELLTRALRRLAVSGGYVGQNAMSLLPKHIEAAGRQERGAWHAIDRLRGKGERVDSGILDRRQRQASERGRKRGVKKGLKNYPD